MNPRRMLFPTALIFSLAGAMPYYAATLYWDGNMSTPNNVSDNTLVTAQGWLSGGNWDNGTTSVSVTNWNALDGASFGGTGGTVELSGDISATSLTFNHTTGTYVLTSNSATPRALNLSGGITSGTGAVTLGDATKWLELNFPGNQSWSIGAGGLEVVSSITITGQLTKDGTGTLTLTGTNTFTGAVNINAGTLRLNRGGADNSAIPTDGNPATNNDITIAGGTLELASSNQIGDTGSITMTSGAFNFGAASGLTESIDKLTISGGSFTTGANTLDVLGATVTCDGGLNTISNGGTVKDKHWVITGGLNVVATGGTLEVKPGANGGFEMQGTASPSVAMNGTMLLNQDVTVDSTLTSGTASITGNGSIDMEGAARTFTINNGSGTTDMSVSAVLTNGGLTKTGAGTLVLSGANTYLGATAVNLGTLVINGNQSAATGAVTVAAGATLKGNGAIGGATTLAAETGLGLKDGGLLAPGHSVGKETFTSALAFSKGSILEWELGATPKETGTPGVRGTDYDAVNASTLGGSDAIFRVVLNGDQTFADSFWDASRSWTDIFMTADAGAALTYDTVFGSNFQYYNGSGALATPTAEGSFTISGGTLTWNAVPEPTNSLVGLLIAAGLLRRRPVAGGANRA